MDEDGDGEGSGSGGARVCVWPDAALGEKLFQALQDPLAVAGGLLPQWCTQICAGFPELTPLAAREHLFRCVGFGAARSVHAVRVRRSTPCAHRRCKHCNTPQRGAAQSNTAPFLVQRLLTHDSAASCSYCWTGGGCASFFTAPLCPIHSSV